MRFDHIFFTGSPAVGRHVMAAAARHLTPVTLELGGKSPAIVDETADIARAAERLIWGKCLNAGQTCVAPDYLLIQEDRLAAFLAAARRVIENRYGADAAARRASPDYGRLVSEAHQRRLADLLEAAVEQGARIAFGGDSDAVDRYLEPTLVTGVTADSPLMAEELFGPILPILTFGTLAEAIALVRAGEKPLALYLFSNDRTAVERVLAGTSAGGSCVNTLILHLANPDLPFGGVGQSGMGNYHGFAGFRNLSHERALLTQGRLLDGLRRFYPPYTGRVGRLLELAAKYLS
jgi:aldehyde dehydrogenase (NAD+)